MILRPFELQVLVANRNLNLVCRLLHHWPSYTSAAHEKRYHIAVVGATGAVGAEIFRVLERRGFPVAQFAPSVRSVRPENLALFHGESSGRGTAPTPFEKSISRFSARGCRLARIRAARPRSGAIVIDNSPAFRMDPDVPLVIPEINGDDAKLIAESSPIRIARRRSR